MPPATGPALIILVAFVLPGFVTVLIQENTYRRAEDPTALDRLLRILYYSVWTYLLLAVFALAFGIDRGYVEHFYEANEGQPAELVWRGALLVLVAAVIIATITRSWYGSTLQAWVIDKAKINEHHLEPTAWDYFFRKAEDAHVRVTMKDGARVYGYYGSESFAAYAKDGGDLLLETVFVESEDEFFGEPAKESCGVWLPLKDVVCIEFYSSEHADTSEAAGETPAAKTPEGNGSQTASAEADPATATKEGLIENG
jgi:hypothetical protein